MDKIYSPIKERIVKYIDIQGISKELFYNKSFLTASNFKGKGAKSELGGDKIVKILTAFPAINPEWLLTGEGSMLKNTTSMVAHSKEKGIPLIPIDAAAGFGSGDFSSDVLNDADQYVIPDLKGRADYMIRIQGTSMEPSYNSGDVIACMKVNVDDFFQWNRPYVLDTKQGPMVKRIKKSSLDGHVTLISDNKDYDPFDVKISEIRSIALIVALIRIV